MHRSHSTNTFACVCEISDGLLVAWDVCECMPIRSSTVWLLPFTLLQILCHNRRPASRYAYVNTWKPTPPPNILLYPGVLSPLGASWCVILSYVYRWRCQASVVSPKESVRVNQHTPVAVASPSCYRCRTSAGAETLPACICIWIINVYISSASGLFRHSPSPQIRKISSESRQS
jgi:hypothetical protein